MTPNSADKRKALFQPENDTELLLGWLIHSRKGRQRHDWAARRLERQRLLVGALAAIFSAVVGASVFISLQKEESVSPNVKLGLALVTVFSAAIVGLSTFLNLAERAEKHRAAGVQYKGVIRELERRLYETKEPVASQFETKMYIHALEKKLNELEQSTPIVPESIYTRVDDDWKRGIKPITKALDLYSPSSEVESRSSSNIIRQLVNRFRR